MSNVVNSVFTQAGNFVNTVAQDVGTVITTAIENPIPIIETIAVTYALGPEGLALSNTIGATATAAVSSAAVAAMNGASVEDVAKAAAAGAAGSYVSQNVATTIGAPPVPGEPPTPPTPPEPPVPGQPPAPPTPPTPLVPDSTTALLANIAGSAAGSAVSTAIMGGNASQVVQNALAGSLGAGTSAAAQYAGASPTVANVLGGYASGASQAGGSVLSGLQGAAGGAGKTTSVLPTGQTVSEAPFVDLSQGTVVGGLTDVPGELPSGGFQPGQITQTAAGLFTTYVAQDGTTVNIPITVNATTGEITTTSTEPEALNAVKVLRVDPTKVNPVFYDKTPIDPGLSAEEKAALANVASQTSQDMINALKSGKAIDEYYNTYAYTSSLPTFVTQMAQELANDPTGTDPSYNSLRAEYKAVTGTDFISPSGVPNIILPPVTIVASRVISSDPATGVTFVVGADGNPTPISSPTPLTPGQTIAYNSATNTVVPNSVTNQTPADVNLPTPTTPPSPDTTPTPTTTPTTTPSTTNLTGPANIPSTGAATSTQTAIAPAGTYAPATPPSPPSPTSPTAPVSSRTPTGPTFPTATTTSPIAPSAVTTLLGTPTPGQTQDTLVTPTGPSTEKTPYPTFKPDVFVESNVPKTLAGALNIGGNLPLAGQTVGLGGGGGGVSVESGQEQKPVWNVASLKLKDEAEGTPDYGALSSALGI